MIPLAFTANFNAPHTDTPFLYEVVAEAHKLSPTQDYYSTDTHVMGSNYYKASKVVYTSVWDYKRKAL